MKTPQLLYVGHPDTEEADYHTLAVYRLRYRFQYVRDAEALWHYLDQQKKLPSCILLDSDTPDYRSLQTLEILRDFPRYRKIKLVVYTSVASPEWKRLCLRAGAHQVKVKPRKRMPDWIGRLAPNNWFSPLQLA